MIIQMEQFLRDNVPAVLEFLNQIINNLQAFQQEILAETFSAAKYWCEYSSKTFIPHEGFIESIFKMLESEQPYLKVIKIIKKLLIKSKYVKLLNNTSFDQAFKEIPEKDQKFLELIVSYLQKNRNLFIKSAKSDINDDEA